MLETHNTSGVGQQTINSILSRQPSYSVYPRDSVDIWNESQTVFPSLQGPGMCHYLKWTQYGGDFMQTHLFGSLSGDLPKSL